MRYKILEKNMKIDEMCLNSIFLVTMYVFTFLGGVVAHVSFEQIALYLVVQIFVIYSLGKTFFEFINLSVKSILSKQILSYALGYGLCLVIYLILLLVNKPILSAWIIYVMATVNIIFRVLHKKEMVSLCNRKCDVILTVLVFAFAALFMFFCFQANMLSANVTGYCSMHPDNQFWLREAVEGTRGIPMKDFSAVGVIRKYYYFSGTWCSLLHYLTGIELFDICFSLSWVGDLFLLVGAIYVLFSEGRHNGLRVLLIAFLALLFSSGATGETDAYYLGHLYVAHFGFLPSLAMGMLSLCYIIKWFREDKKADAFAALFFFFLCYGLKGPIAYVNLVCIGMLCVFKFFSKKNLKGKISGLVVGLFFLSIFAFTWTVMRQYPDNDMYKSGDVSRLISLVGTVTRPQFFLNFYHKMCSIINNKYIAGIFISLIYIVLTNPLMFLLLFWAFVKKICSKAKLTYEQWALLMTVVIGYLLFIFINHGGFSQVYFGLAVFPAGIYLATDILGEKNQERNKWTQRLSYFSVFVVMVWGLFSTVKTYGLTYVKSGVNNVSTKYDESMPYPGSSGNDVNKRELEALRWLRDFSDEDDIIITNLELINEKSFTTCCYSERQAFIEGEAYGALRKELRLERDELVRQYYMGNNESLETLIDNGVRYAVVFSSVEEYREYLGSCIFDNGAVKIIKLY